MPTEHFFWARSCAGLWAHMEESFVQALLSLVPHSHPVAGPLVKEEGQCQDSTGRRVPLNLGGMRRGQRISPKERACEPGLEGQVSFCRLGKYGKWHPGNREGHLQRCRGGRSTKAVLFLSCRRKEPLALPGSGASKHLIFCVHGAPGVRPLHRPAFIPVSGEALQVAGQAFSCP